VTGCQVFISHSSADRRWVEWIAVQAQALGVVPYLAEHDPKPGTSLSEKVREAIRQSDAMIVLLTTSGMDSPYVHQEIGVAVEQGKLVVPLVHPAVQNRSLAMLDGKEYILFDFDDPRDGSSSLILKLQELASAAAARDTRQQLRENLEVAFALAAMMALIYLASQGDA